MGRPGGHTGESFAGLGGVAHADTGRHGHDHQGRQGPFHEHRTVAHEQRIVFRAHLLGRRARRDQGMKTGDGPAGDGDEEERPHGRCLLRGHLHGRRHHVQMAAESRRQDAQDHQGHGDHQLVGVDEIARLKQGCNRQHRGDEAVGQQNDGPHAGGRDAEDGGHLDGQVGPQKNKHVHEHDGPDGESEDAFVLAVHQVAQGHGDGHLDPNGQDRLRIHGEDDGDHQAEDGDHDPQFEEDDEEEEQPRAAVDILGGVIRDRLALVAHGDDQRAEVMHGAHHHAAHEHPQQRRHPAPDDGDGRAHDGSRAGDGGEVVSEDHLLLGRHIVDAVLHGHRGDDGLVRQAEDYPADISSVELIHHQVTHKCHNHDQQCFHRPFLLC